MYKRGTLQGEPIHCKESVFTAIRAIKERRRIDDERRTLTGSGTPWV
jgi:hypothetical protein